MMREAVMACRSVADSQFSQTAHFALQTPYTVFGLGQTPNFIDELSVGLPLRDNQVSPVTRPRLVPQPG